MKKYVLFSCWILSCFVSVAQTKTATKPVAKPITGRNIPITLTPLKNCKVYLGSYLGTGRTLVDSTMLNDKSQGIFKGDKKLPGGIYFVVSPQMTIQFELLMDDVQQFSIKGDTSQKDKAEIIGSADNDLFKSYTAYSIEKGQLRQQLSEAYKAVTNKTDSTRLYNSLTALDKEVQQYRMNIIQQHPNSLLAMFFNTMKTPETPTIPVINGKPDSAYPFRYVKEHFWDDVAFNDDRLLRTPFFEPKLDDYFRYYVSPEPDSIIEEVKYILLSARTGKEIYPYLLTKFTNKYMNPEFMGQDKVFVYLFENFYAKGDTMILNPSSRKTVTERAYSLMANQLGKPAPVLNLTDTTGKMIPLYSLKSEFTVVAFWDPNCGHCKEEMPRLDSFYRSKWKALGVSIYGVNIYENEVPAWKKFIAEKKLSGWTHAYQTKAAKDAEERAGVPNYRQLYDIFKTPTLYLLDKDKRIIAKQLSLEQFDDLIVTKSNQK
ncbi:MAG: redoxin domain-containing protein [Chitinophagaceae bacterium]|nr:redoxin domain-containing protein [Chitinophagaceae bacterium]